MKVRLKDSPEVVGFALQFNIHTVSPQEIIVGFDNGEIDTDYMRNYEVLLSSGEWKDAIQAYQDHDIITDNYNVRFFEPSTDEDRKRGYTL